MLVKTIDKDAEQAFIDRLDELRGKTNSGTVLHCKLAGTDFDPKPARVLELLNETLADRNAGIYFMHDGDLLIWWVGRAAETERQLKETVCADLSLVLGKDDEEMFFTHYDFSLQAEELRKLCAEKLSEKKKKSEDTTAREKEEKSKALLQNLEKLKGLGFDRPRREKPEILLVEDIDPTRKLLKALIGNSYVCHAAANLAEAANLYLLHAPDIVFLDIELPDGSGHDLARIFSEIDKDSYIIMATANHFERDVNIARENKVKGYVIKPLTMEKVNKCMEKYFSSRG